MQDITPGNFGIVIGYLIPGFGTILAISDFWPGAPGLLAALQSDGPTVGGFLYVTLGSLGVGLLLSTLRWLVLDWLHHRTGVVKPRLDFSRLNASLPGFAAITTYHYEYYKFYGNSLIATIVVAGIQLTARELSWQIGLLYVVVAALLLLGSRDTLQKFYSRTEALIGSTDPGQEVPAPPTSAVASDAPTGSIPGPQQTPGA